jgi:hypothetical protein
MQVGVASTSKNNVTPVHRAADNRASVIQSNNRVTAGI